MLWSFDHLQVEIYTTSIYIQINIIQCIYYRLKMVVWPKHVAVNLKKTVNNYWSRRIVKLVVFYAARVVWREIGSFLYWSMVEICFTIFIISVTSEKCVQAALQYRTSLHVTIRCSFWLPHFPLLSFLISSSALFVFFVILVLLIAGEIRQVSCIRFKRTWTYSVEYLWDSYTQKIVL
jgi:hypothetical protein